MTPKASQSSLRSRDRRKLVVNLPFGLQQEIARFRVHDATLIRRQVKERLRGT